MLLEDILQLYHYEVPARLIARKPATPRDAARLLIYDKKADSIEEDTFSNIYQYLPDGALLVFNDTKVLPARLLASKISGGKVELLYLSREKGGLVRVMIGGKVVPGDSLLLADNISFQVVQKDGKYALLKPNFIESRLFSVLKKYGKTPLPPYIKNPLLSEALIRREYQTVFARRAGSVAAPTASLHFTKGLMSRLKRRGYGVEYITLHVNLGTFAPLTEEHIQSARLHTEDFSITPKAAAAINKAKKEGRPIIAVGTTVVRALESVAHNDRVAPGEGSTSIFIRDSYRFRIISGLVTNFHVPGSSLMMLVSALTGREKLLELYAYAKKKKFRFFSFGDGMLIR